jgi:anti-anti-sigma factor
MSIKKRAVSVYQVPSEISSASEMELLRQLQMSAETGHPRFVLDCSKVASMGSSAIRLLLCCLEEVMKNNGDVRLAMLHPEANAVLRHTGISRLFESYDTTENAIHSYQLRPSSMGPLAFEAAELDQNIEYAA